MKTELTFDDYRELVDLSEVLPAIQLRASEDNDEHSMELASCLLRVVRLMMRRSGQQPDELGEVLGDLFDSNGRYVGQPN